MKTLTHLLVAVLCCWAGLASAQCGVVASFSDTINPNNVPLFQDNSTVYNGWTVTNYYWDFGDGSTSNQQNPTHVFQQPGNYNVCHYVIAQTNANPVQTCIDTFCAVYSNCSGIVQANITYQSTNGVVVYTGTATSNYPPISYSWTFPGGMPAVSTTAITTVQYNAGGIYDACLTATDANGCYAHTCQTVAVTVANQCNGAQADYTYTTGTNSLSAQSTTTNANGSTLYQWWLDGQSTTPSSNPSYSNANLSAGMHTLCLNIYSGTPNYFCDSVCKTFFIAGTGPCGGAQADFTYTATSTTILTDAHAANYPTGTQFQWVLNGNAGGIGSGANTYLYQNLTPNTTYQVCLNIYDVNNNLCDSYCQNIYTGTGCNTTLSPNFTYSATPTGVIFFGSQNNPQGTYYEWHFGEGSVSGSSSSQTSFQYPADSNAVVYNVCLIVHIPGTVCADTLCQQVTIPGTSNCNADFTWSFPQNANTPFFQDLSTGAPTSWLWDFGDGSTSTTMNTSHTFPTPGGYNVCLTISNGSCTSTICNFIAVGSPLQDTICGITFSDNNSNGVLDSNETVLPGVIVVAGNNTALSDSDGLYKLVNTGGFAVDVFAEAPQGCVLTLPVNTNSGLVGGYYYATPNNPIQGCGYNFGFNCNVVTICGTAYFDANNNNVQDNAENGLPNIHVTIVGAATYHAYTNQSGGYCITVPAGTYVINAASNNFNTCSLSPSAQTVAATTVGQQYGGNNFALYCQPGACNLAITITPHTTVTPGFPAWYDMQVFNVGPSPTTGGTANFFYNPGLTFNYANPAQSSHNASTQTLTFNLPSLMPGQSEYYWLNFNASQSLQLNAPIFTLANVIGNSACSDVNLTNNVDTIHQGVTGSWDPNNKLAYVTNYETNPAYQLISSIDANQRIEYVINFQNEGNGPAVNVVIKDLITSDLDISSFELLGTSHNCQVTLNGNDANFKFSNIMLPAKITDEPNSHGFVKFAINANSNLAEGHVIADDAAIYFDYNQPVITNESQVTLLGPNGIDEASVVTATIAPNPMSQYTTIKLSNNSDGFKMRVTDLTGRLVSETITNTNSFVFERGTLAAGLYTYQVIQNNKAVANGKLVIQ